MSLRQLTIKLITLISIISLIIAAQYRRLQTGDTTRLKAQDKLISTLGIFRLTLKRQQCQLFIQIFDDKAQLYTTKGNYKNQYVTNNCQYLQLVQGKLVTDSGQEYMKLDNPPYSVTSFAIDDTGIIYIIGYQQSLTAKILPKDNIKTIKDFYTQHPFIKSTAQQTIDFTVSGSLTNLREWRFLLNTAQLEIFKDGNPGIIVAYVFSHLQVRGSGLYDFNSLKMPFALFSNITFTPRCFQPQKYMDHKAPFVFTADPYWPIFRLYQQGRYIVKQVAYGDLSQYDFPSPDQQIHFVDRYSPCPDYTFQHKGNCIAKCPPPYYHDMIGSKGRCVLTCEEDTVINADKRICECMTSYESGKFTTELIFQCPQNSEIVPYGCSCLLPNQYFDRYISLKCASKLDCPPKTFPSNGLCMKCPPNCKTCQVDGFFRAYLQCKECQIGYKILSTGKCGLSCNPNYGLSLINNACVPCADVGCMDCSTNANICTKCNPNYALQNSKCIKQCSSTFKQTHKQNAQAVCLKRDTTCLSIVSVNYRDYSFLKCDSCPVAASSNYFSHLDQCVMTCPTGFKPFNTYCKCQNDTLMTVGDRCMDLPGCPIKMSYDLRSSSCLSCPQGCISCIQNSCTSCAPGYFLRIAPQFVTCFRKSPLTNCEQQYAFQQNVCVVKTFASLDMTLCISKVSNCRVCTRLSQDFCVLCQQGFKIYNNTCIVNCPAGLIPYQNTCVVPEISNCSVPHILTERFPIIVNGTILIENLPYSYYIQNQITPFNIPVGYIPYSQLLIQQEDKKTRNTFVTESSWICLKCKDGQGLSDDFRKCLQCPAPCITCYLARNDSCLTIGDGGSSTCPYRNKATGQCLQSCPQSTVPIQENKILYCVPQDQAAFQGIAKVDSAIYKTVQDNKVVFFIFDDFINKNGIFSLQVSSMPSIQKVKKLSVSRSLQNASQLLQTISGAQIKNGTFIQISNTNNSIFLLNLTGQVQNLRTQNGFFFPNQIYGSQTGLTHPQFMTTWLAWVGYIMSIVIIVLHIWFIGNQLLYKVDNLIIFVQSIYFFSFVKLLVGRLLAQFYYGWIYAHAGFFPNYFSQLIPENYFERSAPNSFKLATMDANVLRNAGFSMSLLITYLFVVFVVIAFLYLLIKLFKKTQFKYPYMAKLSIVAGIQFVSMSIMFWSAACLMYNDDYNLGSDQKTTRQNTNFHNSTNTLAIVLIILVCVYTLIRFAFDKLGGLYMLKRIVLAVILAASSMQNIYLLVLVLVTQIVFSILRGIIQQPQTSRQKFYIFIEWLLITIAYLLLFLSLNTEVNTVIVSIIIFLFMIFLAGDLATVYLQSQNEYQDVQEEKGDSRGQIAKQAVESLDEK